MAKKSKVARRGNGQSKEAQTVAFEYIKGQLFRVIHADGAVGSVTPNGNVHMALFSERPAIPRMMVHKRNPNGTLGDPIPEQTVSRPGIIREMDVDVVLGPMAVDALIDWLRKQKAELEKRAKLAKEIQEGRK